jgi:hypothetical protein
MVDEDPELDGPSVHLGQSPLVGHEAAVGHSR